MGSKHTGRQFFSGERATLDIKSHGTLRPDERPIVGGRKPSARRVLGEVGTPNALITSEGLFVSGCKPRHLVPAQRIAKEASDGEDVSRSSFSPP